MSMMVRNGTDERVPLKYSSGFSYLGLNGIDFSQIEKELVLDEYVEAPVEPGMRAGVLQYRLGGKTLGEVEIVTDGAVKKAGYRDYLKKLWFA